MDITNYRKHVVNSPYVTNHILPENSWDQVKEYVPQWQRFAHIRPSRHYLRDDDSMQNHPKVNSHEACWINYTTLCLGYRLRTNPTIFRPIFHHDRQRKINLFQKNIKRVVKKRNEKRAFIELFKLKHIPRVLIEKIITLAY
jgi:hypothetical protein